MQINTFMNCHNAQQASQYCYKPSFNSFYIVLASTDKQGLKILLIAPYSVRDSICILLKKPHIVTTYTI